MAVIYFISISKSGEFHAAKIIPEFLELNLLS
jgi:hypothetical protein